MKVSIIVGGKFHAFNLKELNLNGYLKQITSYPKYSLKNFQIEKKIKSILIKELLLKSKNFIFSKHD